MNDDVYFAGLFDDEGWFHINKNAHSDRRPSFQVYASIAVRQRYIVIQLQKTYGGSIRVYKSKNVKHSDSWRWTVVGEQTIAFAIRMMPYLKIKTKQVRLTIKFQSFKRLNKNRPNSVSRHTKLECMYEQMKAFNRRGPSI